MASTYSDLKIELIGTGEQTGTWGTTTNDNFSIAIGEAITGSADVAFSSADVTVTLTNTNASQAARNLRLNLTGTSGGARNLILGSGCQIEKLYLINNGLADAVTVANTTGTGITVPAGKSMFVYNNGTNVVDAITYLSSLDTGTINATTVDTTNLEVTNLKAKDGTSAGSIANSTGVVTLASSVLTTTDINGGTIDGTTIGASTPSTVVATQVNITGQGDLRLEDTTGGEYVALQAPSSLAGSYTLTMPVDDGTNGQALITDGNGVLSWSTAASGDVYGPASATDNAVARFDLTTGKIIQNSVVIIADTTGDMTGVGTLSSGAITTTGVLTVPAGTVSAPAITTTGDTNTGIFFPAADTIAFAEGGAEAMRITSAGDLLVGATATRTNIAGTAQNFLIEKTAPVFQALVANENASGGSLLSLCLSRGSTVGSNTIVQSGDQVGGLTFRGNDGTNFLSLASIVGNVDGTPGTNDMPGRLVFSTTADGSASPTERMRINSSGNVQIGGTTDLGRLTVYNTTTDPSLSSNSGVGLCVRGSSTVRLNMGSYSTSPFAAWIQASDGASSSFGLSLQPLGGNVGIGTSSPGSLLEIAKNDQSNGAVLRITNSADSSSWTTGNVIGDLNFYSSDSSAAGTRAQVRAVCSTLGTWTNTNPVNVDLTFSTYASSALTERMRLDSSGNLGLGVTPSAWTTLKAMEFAGVGNSVSGNGISALFLGNNANFNSGWKYSNTAAASQIDLSNGGFAFNIAPSGTAGNAITWTRAMTLNASGQLGIGTSSPVSGYKLTVACGTNKTFVVGDAGVAGGIEIGNYGGVSGGGYNDVLFTGSTQRFFTGTAGSTSLSERMRINSFGDVFVAKTAQNVANAGCELRAVGMGTFTNTADYGLVVNRNTDDGDLVLFRQDNTTEGTISVSGTAVSYNGGHLSRWSQLPDGSKDDTILKGTVLTNLDDMCVWEKDGVVAENEQLNKMKVSDVEGDTNVAGVFVNWTMDEQYGVDDMNVAMTGDMIIRIADGVVVQKGDLLMSAGDGTAKPQGDDIVRSKTIAKVTSNYVTCTYADGSYCVPCVLMAC